MSERNSEKHLSSEQLKANVLREMLRFKAYIGQQCELRLSEISDLAFEGYVFATPQAAALAISKTIKTMVDDGVVLRSGQHYQLTSKGVADARTL